MPPMDTTTKPPITTDRQQDRWHNFIGEGENPNGFVAVTPNGNASDRGAGNTGWAAPGIEGLPPGPSYNGKRWELPAPGYPLGMGMPVPTRGKVGSGIASNRNRSGE